MNSKAKKLVTAGAFATLVAASAFAAPQYDNGGRYDRNRGQDQQQSDRGYNRDQRDQRDQRDNRGYREDQRVTTSGRITSLSRERDGYRVRLDRGRDSYFIPESRLGGHRLRVGIDISLGGIFNGGMINVDAVNWPGNYGYGDGYDNGGYLQGRVDRVDYRDGFARLDTNQGHVQVRLGRQVQQLRRGDWVSLEGQWDRRGEFEAYRIDDVR